jgi:hypothetical protein
MASRTVERRSFTGYSPELAEKICAALADGRRLASICAEAGMPSTRTVFRWLATHPDFLARYEQVREGRVGMPYSRPVAQAICDELAEGRSLLSICSDEGMPGRTTVYDWLGQHAEFREMFERARQWQATSLLDEALDIADDGRNDWMRKGGKDDSGWVTNGENLRRSKLRIDTRRWALAQLAPKWYGPKGERGGKAEAPVVKIIREIVDPRPRADGPDGG